jgi:hypothetical protein
LFDGFSKKLKAIGWDARKPGGHEASQIRKPSSFPAFKPLALLGSREKIIN